MEKGSYFGEGIIRLRDFEAMWDELYPGEQARIVGQVDKYLIYLWGK